MAKAILVTDEHDTCDCCGRTGLKRTVLMQLDDNSLAYYGTTCAARNTGKDQRQIKEEIALSQFHRENMARNEWREQPIRKELIEVRCKLVAIHKQGGITFYKLEELMETAWNSDAVQSVLLPILKKHHLPANFRP